ESNISTNHDEHGYAIRERKLGRFSRTLQLPQGVKEDEIRASMENGVLSVVFPKSSPEAPKKITIRLTVGGESNISTHHDEHEYAIRERKFGRTLQLPQGVKEDEIRDSRREDRRERRGPDIDDIVKKLEDHNMAQKAMLEELSKSWREDFARYHEETISRVEATATRRVKFNIQGYLDEFSKAFATEVRMLLGEVGKLRDERRGLQHELGQLLVLRSKYGPGGEFDPDWKPAPGQPGGPPLDPPQPPEPPEPPAPNAPPEAPPPPQRSSWAQWRPDISQVKSALDAGAGGTPFGTGPPGTEPWLVWT
ncbi:hypothetical protein DXG01_012802, partial [Tephrocybe rancida]